MDEGKPGNLTCVYCGFWGDHELFERRVSVKFDGEVMACRDVILCLKTETRMRKDGLIT